MASLVETVLRSRDLLHVQFEFVNLTLETAVATNPVLKRTAAGPAFIVVRLPPQHVAEDAFDATEAREPPYASVVACPSRIAFAIPDDAQPIAFTVSSLLCQIAHLPPFITAGSPGPGAGTYIEFPDRVLLVPEQGARLFHRTELAQSTSDGSDAAWTELWHTRIGSNGPRGPGPTHFRAVDNTVDTTERLQRGTLTLAHRREIVARCTEADALLVGASQCMLTALGASARLKSEWPATASPFLSSWEHQAVTGRDRFVRVVEQGFLYPFGHRASRQTITQRDFSTLAGSTLIAGLERDLSLTIEEAERDYGALHALYPYDGREMPLKRIRIVSPPASIAGTQAPVLCGVVATDSQGHEITFDLKMFFLTRTEATSQAVLDDRYTKFLAVNTTTLRPQGITLADDTEGRGDTHLTVTALTFDVKPLALAGTIQPPFLPFMRHAAASIPAVEQFLGTVSAALGSAGGLGGPAAIGRPAAGARSASAVRTLTLHDNYLNFGFPSGDDKQLFATFDPPTPPIALPAERAGGLTAPTFNPMDGVSRVRGLVADVGNFASDQPIIDPQALLGNAKLLGVITLAQIIDRVVDHVPAAHPETLFEKISDPDVFATRPVLTTVQTPSGIEVRFLWKPVIKRTGLPPPLIAAGREPITLIVKGRMTKGASTAPDAAFEVDGRLRNFGLQFGDLLTVTFDEVAFTSGGGRKLRVDTKIKAIEFGAGLAFIKKISEILPKGALGDAPDIKPQADGVVVSVGFGLPSFAIGVMSLQNIAVSASLSLPFVEKPAAVRFALSERSHPFLVSVSIFGGTGFFALEIRNDSDKSIQIEAAIEFGGTVSINLLGIVQGGVYAFVGVFVSVDSHGKVAISGHIRIGGYVDVAGLITVSIEFQITLTPSFDDKVLIGEGRVTIGVKVLFFSLSQTFVVTRRIAGFGDPPAAIFADTPPPLPTFANTINALQWEQYCKAYA